MNSNFLFKPFNILVIMISIKKFNFICFETFVTNIKKKMCLSKAVDRTHSFM